MALAQGMSEQAVIPAKAGMTSVKQISMQLMLLLPDQTVALDASSVRRRSRITRSILGYTVNFGQAGQPILHFEQS